MLKKIKVVVEEGEARTFYSNKGVATFKKLLAKKGFVEERCFKQLVSPFKEKLCNGAERSLGNIGSQ